MAENLTLVVTLKNLAKGGLRDLDNDIDRLGGTSKRTTALMSAGAVAMSGLAIAAGAAAVGVGVSVKKAIEFESAFTGVRKTVDATEEEFASIRREIIDLSNKIPITATELSRIGEVAGQLGVQSQDIVKFSKTIADIGVSTDLTTEEAAVNFARISNIMQEPIDQVDRMASSVVDLGNNFATNEPAILEFANRIAGAAEVAGLASADVFGISAAFSSVGVQAERGGSAVSKTLFEMTTAVSEGSDKLKDFANVAGLSSEEFQRVFREDAAEAFRLFVAGLGERGIEATALLDELELSDSRLVQSFVSVANAGGTMTEAIGLAGEAYEKNTALTDEANKRYATTESQLEILKNNATSLAIELGSALLPAVNKIVGGVLDWIEKNGGLQEILGRVREKAIELWAVVGPILTPVFKFAAEKVAEFVGTLKDNTFVAYLLRGALIGLVGIIVLALVVIGGIVGILAMAATGFSNAANAVGEFIGKVRNLIGELLGAKSRADALLGAMLSIISVAATPINFVINVARKGAELASPDGAHTGGHVTEFGRIRKFASGGVVPGVGNRDSVPALLTPGETVLPRGVQPSQNVFEININNPVVRQDNDIDEIVRRVQEGLNRTSELAQLGQEVR